MKNQPATKRKNFFFKAEQAKSVKAQEKNKTANIAK